jgi:hypothetical protein
MNNRPFYSRLPSETPNTYQGNEVSSWLGSFWDKLYFDCQQKIKELPRQFDPETCDEEYLDFLAPICGFTAPYWNKGFPVDSKRLLLKNAYSLIWKDKGTLNQLSFVLTALHIDHKIITPGSFILGDGLLNISPLGSGGWQFLVVLPSKYKENGREYLLCKSIIELYTPIWCDWSIEIERLNENETQLLGVDANTLLNANNSIDIHFNNFPGNFNDATGNFNDPVITEEEVNIKLN